MGKIAFVFSGQGAQHPGMGKDLYENCGLVRDLFDQAETARPGTLDMMFEGDEQTLCKTENTQPCLYLADLAPALMLAQNGVHPHGAAGFSLGELPALAFSGVLSLKEGFALTVKRGLFMAQAAKERPAAMAAVVKLENSAVEQVCRKYSDVYPVNYNCPGQLVVAAACEQLSPFTQEIRALGGMVLPLKTAGGFHSPFMDRAAVQFAEQLEKTNFAEPSLELYANRTGKRYSPDIRPVLAEQMNHPVLWEQTIRQMEADGYDTFVETGVGQVLAKLISKILPQARVYHAENKADCLQIAGEVRKHA